MVSTFTRILALIALAAGANAQNHTIDLTKWTIEHINSSGTWTIDAPKLYCSFTNSTITDCSVLYSDFNVTQLEFRMSIQSVGDDDIVGFVLGWNPGDATNANSDYLLVDWKRATQNYGDWGTANAGLALSRVTGIPTPGVGGGPIDLWSHTGVCKELARGNQFGQKGWDFVTNYYFKVLFTPAFVDIQVNGQQEFRVQGPFKSGRFGCYNFSQSGMEFQFPVQGSFVEFGQACVGAAGSPYLFTPVTPYFGERMPLVLGSIAPTGPALVFLGFSNTNWGAFNLPLDLSPLGARGCSLYVSGDVVQAMPNYKGTGFLDFQLPTVFLPTTTFYVQGAAIDASANALGMIFSNAGTVTVGVR